MRSEPSSSNIGKVVSVRGSIVDIRFDGHLPHRQLKKMVGDNRIFVTDHYAEGFRTLVQIKVLY